MDNARHDGGFALVSVLAILALILVLVLSISSVLHVETRTSASAKNVLLARQNALLGLDTAIAQLQQYAGKDQAVTFPATTFYPTKDLNLPGASYPAQGKGDLFDNTTYGFRKFAQTSSARSYLTKVETYLTPAERVQWDNALKDYWNANRNPRWTGIMDAALRVDRATNPNAPPVNLDAQRYEELGDSTKFGEPKRDQLPVWLVSGNEKFTINGTTTSYPSGYFTPNMTLGDPASDNTVVWLVGNGTATDNSTSVDGMDGRVKAKKVAIHGASSGNATGHFAYWVGDESTKANFAVRDPYFNAAAGSVDYRNRLQVPQRVGWENISANATGDQTLSALATFTANDPNLENISTSKEIGLVEAAANGTITTTKAVTEAAKNNFHSLTAFSRSLLTDTALGGLKKDLTAYLITGEGLNDQNPVPNRNRYVTSSIPTGGDSRFRAWGGSNSGFPNASNSDGLPTWGEIKKWYTNTSAGGSISPDAKTAPVLTYFSMHMGLSYSPPSAGGADGTLNWHWAPVVVLWNPYDVTLGTGVYDLEVKISPNMYNAYLAKTNPSLVELQKDASAQWAMRPVGPVDPNTGLRSNALSFNGTVTINGTPSTNPDFPDPADPLRNYWPIVQKSNPKYASGFNGTNSLPDYYNIGGLGPFVRDDNVGDGTTDAFGRFYYMLRAKDSNMRDPFKTGARTSVSTGNNFGPFGSNTVAALRLNPNNSSTDNSNPLQTVAVLRLRINSSFAPGEAKIFSFRPPELPENVPAWNRVDAIPLAPGVETFDPPATVWFPAFDVINGPESAGDMRFFADQLASTRIRPSLRLLIGGDLIMEAEEFGSEGSTSQFYLGDKYRDLANYGANSGGDLDGDGVTNQNEQSPKFLTSWRPVYDRSDFYNHFNNETSKTASNLWFYGEHFFNPFLSPPGSSVINSGSGTSNDVHQNISAFSRFNFGARNLDANPLVDRLRDRYQINNRNYLGNREGLSKLFHTRSYRKDSVTYWDNKQFSGDNGFALITYRANGPTQLYEPISRIPVRVARRPNSNLLSLGQLQQVNLSPYFWQPSFPVGNSWAGLYNDREAIAGIHSRPVGVWSSNLAVRPVGYIPNSMSSTLTATGNTTINVSANSMLDMSYVLNENLWDSYFFSSIPTGHPKGEPLPNSRLRFTGESADAQPATLRKFDTSAAHLQNFGALNVNSTSVEAWKALLTAFRDLDLSNNPSGTIPIARTLDPIGGAIQFVYGVKNKKTNPMFDPSINAKDIGAVTNNKNYEKLANGLRYLTDDMIQILAERIVDEVRLRGPFLSLADFVNRRLVAPQGSRDTGSSWFQARTNGWATGSFSASSATSDSFGRTDINMVMDFVSPDYDPFIGLQGLTGTLQRAVDLSGINGGVNDPRLGWTGNLTLSSGDLFNDTVFLPRIRNTGPPAKIEMQAPNDSSWNNQSYTSAGVGGNVNATSGMVHRLTTEPTLRSHLDTEHLAGAPAGEVGQVLQGAPGFVTQGDLLAMIGPALTPRGDTFLIRTYGDAVDKSGKVLARAWLEAVVQREIEPVTPASASDKYRYTDKFGRKFKVVSLRWLNPEEV